MMVLCLASCDRDLLNDDEALSLSLNKISFSKDYKTITIESSIVNDSLRYDLCDTLHTSLQVYACGDFLDTLPQRATPKIREVRNIAKEQLASLGMQALVIVDRTMEQALVDNARKTISQLNRFLGPNDIYVSFLDSKGKLSPSVVLTSEILSQDFVSTLVEGREKYLYRAIYEKLDEATRPGSPFTGDNRFILVITDGVVWDEEQPFDPEHFYWQQNLLDLSQNMGEKCPIFYTMMNDEFGMPLEVNNTMISVCERTMGACFDISEPDLIHRSICAAHYLPHNDYQFVLDYPDKRVLSGEHVHLHIDGVQDDVVRLRSVIDHQHGTWFEPIIINGISARDLLIRCVLMGALMILIVYLILQLLVPYIKNKIFERKYISEYTGPNMSIAGRQVSEVCYFCKTPFQPGDKVVASCGHAMHKECWEENNYRCPEHGITCKEDVHYANMKKPFAMANAPYYLSWVLVAMLANIVRCILFHTASGVFQKSVLYFILNVMLSDDLAEQATQFCYRNPHSTGILAMCIVAAIAFMCRRHVPVRQQLSDIALRSVIAYLAGYLIISFDIIICTLFNVRFYHELIGIASYFLVVAAIYGIIAFRSPVRLNVNKLMGVGIMVVVAGLLITHNFYVDQRELYFYLFAIFYVVIALSVAFDTSRIWHCFLRIEGTMKKIDVALFKWILARPKMPVTMGRSVDCTLQITWDAKNKIAPVQAEIREHHGNICLIPTEEGVVDSQDKPLPADKALKLYHGTRFKIGDLVFTYLEKY